jgi:LPS O-antigen subunit length determinant protein (WzzB/FepE family)
MEKAKTYDTIDMFIYLWKKRLPIIIVTIAAAVISIIVSLMMDDYFKASSVVFPTTFISPSTSLLERNTNQEMDPMIIGNEDDVERMIQNIEI